jgi:hypothetical protein
MRARHDDVCLWWKDWHSCSCGYLEEEVRANRCLLIIPGTYIACGEGVGDEKQYCSSYCYNKSINK